MNQALPRVLAMVQPVDPRSRDSKWFQVADQIRGLIASGRYAPGEHLPSNDDLAYATETSVPTVRRALRALALEELITTEQGIRAQVAIPRERVVERLKDGDHVIYRPADPDEQRQFGIVEGADVAVVTSKDGAVRVFPPRGIEFVVGEES